MRSEDVEAIRILVGPRDLSVYSYFFFPHQRLRGAGDAAAIAEFYTEDAVLLPQNQLPIVGKKAIRSGYKTVLEQFSQRQL